MAADNPIIIPTRGDYLKRAEIARKEALRAPPGSLKDGFLKLADEWERIAKAAEPANR